MRRAAIILALTLAASACAQSGTRASGDLPAADPAGMAALLAASTRPVVLNVWGSWCVPCRSEAPLLREAHTALEDEIRFIGVAVRDRQSPARDFIDEFGLGGFEHFFDRPNAIASGLGGRGVPLTFFFAPGGELLRLHSGIIDERSLALGIDELLRRTD